MKDIVRGVEHAQLRWYGHVLRMKPSSEVGKCCHSLLQGKGKSEFIDENLVAVQLRRRT